MRIVDDTGEIRENPEIEEITAVLDGIKEGERRFARLERSDEHFVQTVRNEKDDFVIEFSDGGPPQQAKERFAFEEVVGVFHQFADDEITWSEHYSWKPIRSASGTQYWWWPLAVVVIVAIFMMLLG